MLAAMPARFESNRIDRGINLRYTDHLLDQFPELVTFLEIDGLKSHILCVLEPFVNQIADHDNRGTENLRRSRSRQSDRSSPRDINCGSNADSRCKRTMKACG